MKSKLIALFKKSGLPTSRRPARIRASKSVSISARGFEMRVRHLISTRKTLVSDTNWSDKDLPPRHAPVFAKTRPMRSGWRWRSAKAVSQAGNFILIAQCNVKRGNWSAWLILEHEGGASLVARLEDHASHPGLHAHTDCARSGKELGGQGLDNLARVPPASEPHRRGQAWTEHTFWEVSTKFFRLHAAMGPLFDEA